MNLKSLKEWFYFSKKERTAIFVLGVIILSFFLIPIFFKKKDSDIHALENQRPILKTISEKFSDNSLKPVPSDFFDPNTLDMEGWIHLGIREKTAQTIIHYRQKGGHFNTPEDLRKIYGLPKEDADRLIPFISISKKPKLHLTENDLSSTKHPFVLDINDASQEHWAQLPGISDALASRIVHYRKALHGFKNIDQVGKTYGITPEILKHIKPYLRLSSSETTHLKGDSITEKKTVNEYYQTTKTININTATESEMIATHGISKTIAKAIIIYREQHGKFANVLDVRKIVFITPETYEKILPFISVE